MGERRNFRNHFYVMQARISRQRGDFGFFQNFAIRSVGVGRVLELSPRARRTIAARCIQVAVQLPPAGVSSG